MENKRTQGRIKACQILYIIELTQVSFEDAAKYVLQEENEFVITLVEGVLSKKEELDVLIQESLVNYTISRLNIVDKQIIRIAAYEMLTKITPNEVVINEAINITKMYTDLGDNKASSFNNRLLDTILKRIH